MQKRLKLGLYGINSIETVDGQWSRFLKENDVNITNRNRGCAVMYITNPMKMGHIEQSSNILRWEEYKFCRGNFKMRVYPVNHYIKKIT